MDNHSGAPPSVLWDRIREAERSAPPDRPVVLVVEDDLDSRILIRYALRNVVRTDAASTTADALQMAENTPYDGLLVDLRLPDGAGTEVVEALRDQTPYWGVPMVAVTGYSLPTGSGSFLEAGFDAYLAKPFDQTEIRVLVRHLVVEADDVTSEGRTLDRGRQARRSAAESRDAGESSREDPPTTHQLDAPPDLHDG